MQDFSQWWTRERIEAEDLAWQKERAWELYARSIVEVLSEFRLDSVIEFGCGAGYVGNALPAEIHYAGTDGSADMIDLARRRFPQRNYARLDVRTLSRAMLAPFGWDLACSFAMLKHFALNEWGEMLIRMLSQAKYGLMHVQLIRDGAPAPEAARVGRDGFDNGIDFHHTYIRYPALVETLAANGYELIRIHHQKPIVDFEADEAMILTRRK